MTDDDQGWIASQFARLSTGLKMLLILSVGLFPLGLIAILASVQSAQENHVKRQQETRAKLEIGAQRIDSLLSRSALTIRSASTAVAQTAPQSGICEATLRRLALAQRQPGRYALYGPDNSLRCATAGYQPFVLPNDNQLKSQLDIAPGGTALRFTLFDQRGQIEGAGEYSRDTLAALASAPDLPGNFDLELFQDDETMVLREDYRGGPLISNVVLTEPVADGRLQLRIIAGATPISAAELLTVLLPVMMWIGAGVIGWLILDRLLLRPLMRVRDAVAAYRPGDRSIIVPDFSTPAREIGELGKAFDQVAQTVAKHEADLEAAVERQTRLVREVHHRVKNNLQVVASLLNLHSRGSKNEDVAAAYASIQRRVDALAVVHRNHYAELEDNHGVALKPLVSELAANLRATAPPSAANMSIGINIEPYYVTQDVAVSVAFLITELVEFAMFCEALFVRISVGAEESGIARLSVESDSLRDPMECDPTLFERFDRIITGLSRQLRSNILRDVEAGRYSLTIAIVGKTPI